MEVGNKVSLEALDHKEKEIRNDKNLTLTFSFINSNNKTAPA
jgi:hypothetical protein